MSQPQCCNSGDHTILKHPVHVRWMIWSWDERWLCSKFFISRIVWHRKHYWCMDSWYV